MDYYFIIYNIYIIIYNIIISYSDIYSNHNMDIATEIKSLASFIYLYIGNTSFASNGTVAILKL